jgi:hypothetical protein
MQIYQKTVSSRNGHERENTLIKASNMWGSQLSISFLKVFSHSMLHNSWPTRRRAVIVATRVRFQASPCGIVGIPSGNRTGFCSRTSILPCHCHSTIVPYSILFTPYRSYHLSNWQRRQIKHLFVSLSLSVKVIDLTYL